MSAKTRILSEKTVFKASHFTVNETVLNIKGKREVRHFDVVRRPTVAIFPVTTNHEVYLISEYRYLLKKTLLGSVAGFVEENESPLAAAKRELKEEAGLVAKRWTKLASMDMARSVIKATAHLFIAQDLEEEEKNLEFDEEIEVVKLPLDEALEKVMTGEIQTAASMVGILMLDHMKGQKKI